VTAYQALFPDDSVRVIEVTTGSAAAGLASLARGDCDIVLSSRPCTRSEMDALGSVAAWEGESALALQALAVVVRRDHPRATISMRELLRLRTSQAPTREQLPLVLPPSGSDADDMLRALLPPDAALIAEDQRAVSDTEFRERILTMPDAIGFTSLPVPEGLRALRISDGQGDATSASIDALRGSTYPLVTALHAYTRPGAEAPAVVDLVRHLASEANDEILTRHALVPPAVHFVSGGDRHAAAPTLRARVKGAQRMSTVLHLRQGSTEFDPFSQRALVALARHLETNPHEVIVIGFSDQLGGDSGDLVSKTLAEKAAGELRARGITPAHVIGAGSAVPVADDGRPGGRERNRRVEIWIRTTSDSPTSR
jgi:outer membrane protein OmpA-like peptidoglycan-associated protein